MKISLLKKTLIMSKFAFYGILLQCCTMTILMASVNTMGQRQSINDIIVSIKVEGESLTSVFDELENLTGFNFAYNHKNFNERQKITLSAQKKSLATVLVMISKQTQLSFKRINENIYVLKQVKEESPVEEVIEEIAITVTGKVTDAETGDPLPGVNIIEKGTSNGTITDIEGLYTINVSDGVEFFGFFFHWFSFPGNCH